MLRFIVVKAEEFVKKKKARIFSNLYCSFLVLMLFLPYSLNGFSSGEKQNKI